MAEVKIKTYIRYKERWFIMDLKHEICKACFRRDKGDRKTPFLISRENSIDLGELPAYLLELT